MTEGAAGTTEVVIAGRYRLVSSIGRGAMAEVWEAHDEILARAVAVKILHPHLASDGAFLQRFRREAIAAARLVHPNIVAMFDTGVEGGTAYLVMELVRGTTLLDLLRTEGALRPARVVEIATSVAGALEYAHEAGIVHRDVKPANILLSEDGRVKVADFGIARIRTRATGAEVTQPGTILGTTKYIAPEQVAGERADRRSDIYALGVVLYEMLCGRPPFSGDSDSAVALQHLHADPLRPRQVRPGIPRPLEKIVLTAMARDPDARYQSAADLCTALRSVDLVDDDAQPLVVRDPTPPGGVTPSFRQSERAWLVPTALILLLAGVLIAIGIVFAHTDVGTQLIDKATGRDTAREVKPGPAAGAASLRIVSAKAFDPQGDGDEHGDQTANAFDGNPATAWTTQTYKGSRFSGLPKKGVGLVLRLDGSHPLGRVEVVTATAGWSVQVFVGDGTATDLAGWGPSIVTREGVTGTQAFELGGRSASALLVWITDTGRTGGQFRTEISEVRVAAEAAR